MKVFKRILLGFFTILVVAMCTIFIADRIAFSEFYAKAEKEMALPGTWSGFTSQGFDFIEKENKYLLCGHHQDGVSSSIVYVIDEENTKDQKEVKLYKENGENYTSHAGGITHFGKYVYVTHGKSLSLFLLSDILDGDGKATQQGKISLPLSAAYCYIQDGYLYTGEFYYPEKYETPLDHRLTTPTGEKNMALMCVYPLNKETSLPATDKPEKIFSTVGKVQGMCFTENGKIILSTSWGVAPSQLYVYDLSKIPALYSANEASPYTYTLDETKIPLYYLDSSCLQEIIQTPPMSEELVYKNGRVYISNESADMKYVFGKLTGASFLYSYPIK